MRRPGDRIPVPAALLLGLWKEVPDETYFTARRRPRRPPPRRAGPRPARPQQPDVVGQVHVPREERAARRRGTDGLAPRRHERRRLERVRPAERDLRDDRHDEPVRSRGRLERDLPPPDARVLLVGRRRDVGRRRPPAPAGERGERIRLRLGPLARVRHAGKRLLQLHRRLLRERQRHQRDGDGRRPLDRRREDVSRLGDDVLLLRGRDEPLQRQAHDRGRHEPREPVPRQRLRRVGRGLGRLDGRRRALRALDGPRRDVHDRAHRRPEGAGAGDRRRAVRGPERRGLCRLERLSPRTRSSSTAPSTGARRGAAPRTVAAKTAPFQLEHSGGAVPRRARLSGLRRRPLVRPAPRPPDLLVDGHHARGLLRHLPLVLGRPGRDVERAAAP